MVSSGPVVVAGAGVAAPVPGPQTDQRRRLGCSPWFAGRPAVGSAGRPLTSLRRAQRFDVAAIRSSATRTSASGVKPNFVSNALSGAEAPKVSIPMMLPALPT